MGHNANHRINDIILHSLITRVAYADNHTEEFLTELSDDNELEINVPQDRLNTLTANISIGPKLLQFFNWLVPGTEAALQTAANNALHSTVVVTATSTIVNSHNIVNILIDASAGNITVTLPAPTSTQIFNIKRIDSNLAVVTIVPPSGTIDGNSSLTFDTQYDTYQLVSNGINFYITSFFAGTSLFSLDFSNKNNSMYIPII